MLVPRTRLPRVIVVVADCTYPRAVILVEETFVAITFAVSSEVAAVTRVPEALVNVIWLVVELTVKMFVEVATVKIWEGVEVPMPMLPKIDIPP